MKNPFFRFFSSLKLAVVLLLSLAGILAWGTFYESKLGTRAAQIVLYQSYVFSGLLFLLAMNVLCAALSRYPWKKHQTGFVITHLGIITLLVGSFITQQWGVDGTLPVEESLASAEVILSDLKLNISEETSPNKYSFTVPEFAVPTKDSLLQITLGNHTLTLDEFLPRAKREASFSKSSLANLGAPFIELMLFNDRFDVEEKLHQIHPEKPYEVSLGPAVLSLKTLWNSSQEKEFLSGKKEISQEEPYILATAHSGKQYRWTLKQLKNDYSFSNTFKIKLEKFFPYATVENNQLVNKSSVPMNPAVTLNVTLPNGEKEKHTLFSNFPEFPTLHGGLASSNSMKSELSFRFIYPSKEQKEQGQLEFAQNSRGDKLYYRSFSKTGDLRNQGEVKVDEEYETGWMDLKFKVNKWISFATKKWNFTPIPFTGSQSDNFPPAISLSVDAKENFGLGLGQRKSLVLNQKNYSIQFSKETLHLPFSIHLEKFHVGMDPGTNKAASYESDVVVKDKQNGIEKRAKISMNEPLKYAGYTFYQASYQLRDNEPPISIFSVNQDPGRMIKYLGSLIIVLGATAMFYMNPHYWGILLGRKSS